TEFATHAQAIRGVDALDEVTALRDTNRVAPEEGLDVVTGIVPEATETDKTDETYRVSNGEFLQTVFGHELRKARPVVVSFEGSPASAHGRDWLGSPWQGNADTSIPLQACANNYFSLAAFRPDEAGRVRRQKKSFRALHAVMLDD